MWTPEMGCAGFACPKVSEFAVGPKVSFPSRDVRVVAGPDTTAPGIEDVGCHA